VVAGGDGANINVSKMKITSSFLCPSSDTAHFIHGRFLGADGDGG
jgi:hypothetical protein